jgi:hypothetical protein
MLRLGPNRRHGLNKEGSAQILLTPQMHCAPDEVLQRVLIDEKVYRYIKVRYSFVSHDLSTCVSPSILLRGIAEKLRNTRSKLPKLARYLS